MCSILSSLGYWFYSSSQNAAEEEGANSKDPNEDKIEHITYSGDAAAVKKSEHSNSFDERKTLEDEDFPAVEAQQDPIDALRESVDAPPDRIDDAEAKEAAETVPEPVTEEKEEVATEPTEPTVPAVPATETAAEPAKNAVAEPAKNTVAEPEESPVIVEAVEPTAEEEEAQRVRAEEE